MAAAAAVTLDKYNTCLPDAVSERPADLAGRLRHFRSPEAHVTSSGVAAEAHKCTQERYKPPGILNEDATAISDASSSRVDDSQDGTRDALVMRTRQRSRSGSGYLRAIPPPWGFANFAEGGGFLGFNF